MKEKLNRQDKISRGDIFWCCPRNSSHEHSKRLYIVISNNKACRHSDNILMCPLTTQKKKNIPTHVILEDIFGRTNTIICEDIMVINKLDIMDYVTSITEDETKKLNKALEISLGLDRN